MVKLRFHGRAAWVGARRGCDSRRLTDPWRDSNITTLFAILVDAHFELLLPGRARTKEQHEEKPKYDMMGATIAVGHGSVV